MDMTVFTQGTGVVFVLGYHNDELHMWRNTKNLLSIFQMVELGQLCEYYKNIYYGSILDLLNIQVNIFTVSPTQKWSMILPPCQQHIEVLPWLFSGQS